MKTEPSAQAHLFRAFSAEHLAALGCVLVVCVVAGVWSRRKRGSRTVVRAAAALGILMLLNESAWVLHDVKLHGFDLRRHLPLHLCDMTMVCAILALLTRRQFLYEVAFYFGLGGATQALITPDIEWGFPDYYFIKFFVSHGSLLLAIVVLMCGLDKRPGRWSVPKMFVTGVTYVAVVGFFDWVSGANYGYFRHKPENPSLMDWLGPWPWYIGSEIVLGTVIVTTIYVIYQLVSWAYRRRTEG